MFDKTLRHVKVIWAVGILVWAIIGPAQAAESFGGFKIYSPHVVKSETEIDARAFYFGDDQNAVDQTHSGRIAVGHSFTDYWASELYGVYENKPEEGTTYEVEWENRFQLTPQGKYWADLGALVELERESPTEGDKPFAVRYGVLLEKQVSRWVGTVNLFLENQVGPHASDKTEFQYVARLRYRWQPHFEPDLEFYGAPGPLSGFEPASTQQHQFGPGFAGSARLDAASKIKYSGALLFGVTPDSPDVTPVVRIEYEF